MVYARLQASFRGLQRPQLPNLVVILSYKPEHAHARPEDGPASEMVVLKSTYDQIRDTLPSDGLITRSIFQAPWYDVRVVATEERMVFKVVALRHYS
jgi:hypothetical protein